MLPLPVHMQRQAHRKAVVNWHDGVHEMVSCESHKHTSTRVRVVEKSSRFNIARNLFP